LKVVMTGCAEDGPEWQRHIGNKEKRRKLANRFKDAKDPFKIVIVRDMWLTGFDAPCLHTMYADKPMQGHEQKGRRMNAEGRRGPDIRTSYFIIPTSQLAPRRSGQYDLRHETGHRRDARETRHRLRSDPFDL
jgi:hypothetical protein